MPKHAIQVAVRTRPTAAFASENLRIDEDAGVGADHSVPLRMSLKRPHFPQTIEVQLDPSVDAVSNKQDHWNFKFNNVLYNSGMFPSSLARISSYKLRCRARAGV